MTSQEANTDHNYEVSPQSITSNSEYLNRERRPQGHTSPAPHEARHVDVSQHRLLEGGEGRIQVQRKELALRKHLGDLLARSAELGLQLFCQCKALGLIPRTCQGRRAQRKQHSGQSVNTGFILVLGFSFVSVSKLGIFFSVIILFKNLSLSIPAAILKSGDCALNDLIRTCCGQVLPTENIKFKLKNQTMS